jgi:hypothetical protein
MNNTEKYTTQIEVFQQCSDQDLDKFRTELVQLDSELHWLSWFDTDPVEKKIRKKKLFLHWSWSVLFKHGFNFLRANFTFLFKTENMGFLGKKRKEMWHRQDSNFDSHWFSSPDTDPYKGNCNMLDPGPDQHWNQCESKTIFLSPYCLKALNA